MFIQFFYFARQQGLPISIQEWLLLLEALEKGLHQDSFYKFYTLCRSICIKHEKYFDLYDQCFAAFFYEALPTSENKNQIHQELHHRDYQRSKS